MKPDKTLGRELKAATNLMDRRMHSIISANGAAGITPMHGMILGYLHHEQEKEVYQRDVEAEFSITRSTVTNILQLMEKKGYVQREGVSHDARLKRLRLTLRGEESYWRIDASIRQMEAQFRAGLTPEEYGQLLALLDKVKDVLLVNGLD